VIPPLLHCRYRFWNPLSLLYAISFVRHVPTFRKKLLSLSLQHKGRSQRQEVPQKPTELHGISSHKAVFSIARRPVLAFLLFRHESTTSGKKLVDCFCKTVRQLCKKKEAQGGQYGQSMPFEIACALDHVL
jgi:hypothetical protein